ncbi:hypothetical protein L484_023685 [Morus notabilis]|uniref:Anaphase-promoting complex subunit CDC26 n=1 Tax=Morus notabilis TaxID=981085 RepID=W9RE38_9ROSA|nr:hypothetical protein L484_023685 [Morus notabilis]
MLRRKPTKIEVRIEDKDELEEARKRAAAAAATATSTISSAANTGATSLLQQLDRAKDTSSKAHRIGL